jgi:phage-related protein
MPFLAKTLLTPSSAGLHQLRYDIDRPDAEALNWPAEFLPLQGTYRVLPDDTSSVSVVPLGDLYEFRQPRSIYGSKERYNFQVLVDEERGQLTRLRAFLDPIGTLSSITGAFPGTTVDRWYQDKPPDYQHVRGTHWRVSITLVENKNP